MGPALSNTVTEVLHSTEVDLIHYFITSPSLLHNLLKDHYF